MRKEIRQALLQVITVTSVSGGEEEVGSLASSRGAGERARGLKVRVPGPNNDSRAVQLNISPVIRAEGKRFACPVSLPHKLDSRYPAMLRR